MRSQVMILCWELPEGGPSGGAFQPGLVPREHCADAALDRRFRWVRRRRTDVRQWCQGPGSKFSIEAFGKHVKVENDRVWGQIETVYVCTDLMWPTLDLRRTWSNLNLDQPITDLTELVPSSSFRWGSGICWRLLWKSDWNISFGHIMRLGELLQRFFLQDGKCSYVLKKW